MVTTDFFTPVVDDAYDYGAVAAANSLSDVYAMGGRPFLALNIAAFPPDLPAALTGEIIRGGAEKCKEAGVVVVGGHTVQDKEPKFGLVAIGFVHPDQIMRKSGARVGDRLMLSKPLGFGVATTALKRQQAAPEDVAEVTAWMTRLNRAAGELAVEFGLRCGTDVTGYGLLGHGWELASSSRVGLRFYNDRIPLIGCARKYAEAWTFPGGSLDNRDYFGDHVAFAGGTDEAAQMLLFDAQTSGGLLLAVPAGWAENFLERAAALDQPMWEVGEVVAGDQIQVV